MAIVRTTKKSIDKAAIVEEVKQLMDKQQFVSQEVISNKYNCCRASFYNIMKDNDIDIKSYNEMVKESLNVPANRKVEPISLDKIESIYIDTEAEPKSYEIHPRESFWDDDKKSAKFNFSINPQFIEGSKKKYEVEKEVKDKLDMKDEETNKFYDYNPTKSNFIITSLISRRHAVIDDNTENYIYKGPVRPDLIHNYDKLYDIAEDYINNQVIAAGYDKMKVVVTGLTQCVVAVIKAAIDCNVTLILLHYDNVSGRYNEQFVVGNSSESTGSSLLDLYASSKRYYTYKLVDHDAKYFSTVKKLYVVKIENLDMKDEERIIYVCDNIQRMFELYSMEVQKATNKKFDNIRIAADEIVYGTTNTEFKFNNNFGTYYNQPKK